MNLNTIIMKFWIGPVDIFGYIHTLEYLKTVILNLVVLAAEHKPGIKATASAAYSLDEHGHSFHTAKECTTSAACTWYYFSSNAFALFFVVDTKANVGRGFSSKEDNHDKQNDPWILHAVAFAQFQGEFSSL